MHFEQNKLFYRAIFKSPFMGGWVKYLEAMYLPEFYYDIRYIANGRDMNPDDVMNLARTFMHISLSSSYFETNYYDYPVTELKFDGLENIYHEILADLVRRYFCGPA